MAVRSRSDIIDDVEDHIAENGAKYGEWCIGVTANPKKALFTTHGLRAKGDAWIASRAKDEVEALEVHEYFRTVRKTKATQPRKGDDDVFVYAYKMKPHTRP